MKIVYQWLGKHVHAWYGDFVLALLIFIEGFFFIPVSTLLAFFCLENRRKAFYYAVLATVMSGLGALAGYSLGMLLWYAGGKWLIHYFIAPDKFDQLVDQFKQYQTWTTFVVAFTPVPFKLLTLTAGFCHLPLIPFILISMVARGLRFFGIAGAIYLWGDQVHYYLNKYFYYVLGTIGLILVGTWFLIH